MWKPVAEGPSRDAIRCRPTNAFIRAAANWRKMSQPSRPRPRGPLQTIGRASQISPRASGRGNLSRPPRPPVHPAACAVPKRLDDAYWKMLGRPGLSLNCSHSRISFRPKSPLVCPWRRINPHRSAEPGARVQRFGSIESEDHEIRERGWEARLSRFGSAIR